MSYPAFPSVDITTLGSSFSPSVTLVAGSGATVSWSWSGGSTTGLTPSISFGSAATRTVSMTVADTAGQDALDQVAVFNVGYASGDDTGTYSPSSSYDWTAQDISGIAGIPHMTGLVLFLADGISTLTGTLDFTGLSWLTNIECYQSGVEVVNTEGCTSLQRMVFETNALTSVNPDTVAANLLEFRCADQTGGTLAFSPPLSVPFGQLYHFCVRDQTVGAMPDFAELMPAVQQLWIWNTGQSGELTTSSPVLTDLRAYENTYTSASLAGQFTTGATAYLDLHSNALTSVDIAGCSALQYIDLSSNELDQAAVDGILDTVNGFSTSGGTLNLGGSGNAAPSGTGSGYASSLTGRGWTVTVNSGAGGFTHEDTGHNSSASSTSLAVTLSGTVASGDLLVLYVNSEGGGTSHVSVSDNAGNTWTDAYSGEIWYCANAAAHSGGLTITVATSGGYYVHQMIADRFTPGGTVTYGGYAETGSSGTLGLNYNSTGCGNLGTVPAAALAWGAFSAGDGSGTQSYTAGYQTGTTAPADVIGTQFAGADGTGLSVYVLDCANENATPTWYGTGTGTIGHGVAAYFTA